MILYANTNICMNHLNKEINNIIDLIICILTADNTNSPFPLVL